MIQSMNDANSMQHEEARRQAMKAVKQRLDEISRKLRFVSYSYLEPLWFMPTERCLDNTIYLGVKRLSRMSSHGVSKSFKNFKRNRLVVDWVINLVMPLLESLTKKIINQKPDQLCRHRLRGRGGEGDESSIMSHYLWVINNELPCWWNPQLKPFNIRTAYLHLIGSYNTWVINMSHNNDIINCMTCSQS